MNTTKAMERERSPSLLDELGQPDDERSGHISGCERASGFKPADSTQWHRPGRRIQRAVMIGIGLEIIEVMPVSSFDADGESITVDVVDG